MAADLVYDEPEEDGADDLLAGMAADAPDDDVEDDGADADRPAEREDREFERRARRVGACVSL